MKPKCSWTQNDLDDEYMRKTQGAIFCSGVQFYDEGEWPTKYYLNLEKSKLGSKQMNSILLDNGKLITDSEKIPNEQYKFYKKLYMSDPAIKFT